MQHIFTLDMVQLLKCGFDVPVMLREHGWTLRLDGERKVGYAHTSTCPVAASSPAPQIPNRGDFYSAHDCVAPTWTHVAAAVRSAAQHTPALAAQEALAQEDLAVHTALRFAQVVSGLGRPLRPLRNSPSSAAAAWVADLDCRIAALRRRYGHALWGQTWRQSRAAVLFMDQDALHRDGIAASAERACVRRVAAASVACDMLWASDPYCRTRVGWVPTHVATEWAANVRTRAYVLPLADDLLDDAHSAALSALLSAGVPALDAVALGGALAA